MNNSAKEKVSANRKGFTGLKVLSFNEKDCADPGKNLLEANHIDLKCKTLSRIISDIILICKPDGEISPFICLSDKNKKRVANMLKNEKISKTLCKALGKTAVTEEVQICSFSLKESDYTDFFEAKLGMYGEGKILIIIKDVTDKVQLEFKLKDMSEKDSLTGLYNRLFFEELLSVYDGMVTSDFSVILVDIDGLKVVNDTLGHLYGDLLIIKTAIIVRSVFAEYGSVCRVGGDEFAVLLEGYNQNEIEDKLSSLKTQLERYDEVSDTIKISVSTGYSYLSHGKVNANLMFQEADNNMFQSKLLKESSAKSGLVNTLMNALKARDYITEGHAERMEANAVEMGKILKLSGRQLDRIKLLVKFHDLGKVGIPDVILNKPAKLNSEEWEIMKTHSSIGKRIAETSAELSEIAGLILMHHERWDGKGYPLGLKGEEIPIECRILSIVDAYDAMTNDRPYRKALSQEKAVQQLEEGAGSQFDEELVSVFLSILDS